MSGRPPSRQADDAAWLVLQSELARLMGVSPQSVKRFITEHGLAPRQRYRYSLVDVFAVLYAPLVEEGTGPRTVNLTQAKTDLAVAQRLKIELETEVRRNELIPLDEVLHILLEIGGILASGLTGAAATLGPELAALSDPAACEDLVERELAQVRQDIAERVARFGRDYRPVRPPAGAAA